jgi:hypothetical protein
MCRTPPLPPGPGPEVGGRIAGPGTPGGAVRNNRPGRYGGRTEPAAVHGGRTEPAAVHGGRRPKQRFFFSPSSAFSSYSSFFCCPRPSRKPGRNRSRPSVRPRVTLTSEPPVRNRSVNPSPGRAVRPGQKPGRAVRPERTPGRERGQGLTRQAVPVRRPL